MSVLLRAYPLPYLSINLTASHFQLSSSYISQLTKWLTDNGEEIHRQRLRDAEMRVLSSLAFASAFDLMYQFDRKSPKDFKWDSFVDYETDDRKIKIITTSVNERWGNTGPSTSLYLSRKVFDRSPADVFIASAFSIPTINFLGWFDKEGLSSSATDKAVKPLASSSKIHPLWELEDLEKQRIKGRYI